MFDPLIFQDPMQAQKRPFIVCWFPSLNVKQRPSDIGSIALTETLTSELSPFNIRVVLIEPSSFRTEGILDREFEFFTENPLADYDELRAAYIAKYKSLPGTYNEDPDKAAEAIVDVVRGEGVAKGRPWPEYLFLGEGTDDAVRGKCSKVLKVLGEWVDVTRNVQY